MSRHRERNKSARAARCAAIAVALAASPVALADATALAGGDDPWGVMRVTDAAGEAPSPGGSWGDAFEDAGSPAGDSSADLQEWRTLQDRPEGPHGGSALPEIRPFQGYVAIAGKAHGLDPDLLHAVIAVESNYNVNAVSPKGAIGLMQIMPATGQRYGVSAKDLRQPESNIRVGSRYLAELLQRFGYDLMLALAGYNAGEYAVIRHGMRIPPYAETQVYVTRVLRAYERLRVR